MCIRVRTLAFAVLVAAVISGCGARAGSMPSVTVAPTNEVWDLVYISDSSGRGVADKYAARIEQDLGVEIEVHDLWQGALSAKTILEGLEGDVKFSTTNQGRVWLREFIGEAEVIVVYGNPGESESQSHPWDWECALRLDTNPECNESTSCGPETFSQYEADLSAIYEKIFSIRSNRPVILRTADWYLPWGPLQVWRDCDHESVCKECWRNFSDAIHRVADRHGVPAAGLLEAFSGPDLKEEMPREYIADDVHPSEEGAIAIADVLANLGYEPVSP